ncbi:hypothetical protein LCGC14_1192870 [marine sediment metagenome]|uniref:Uncharacterized protein n=1 Tax=marine sediment metagenome TaxID=412755 RepID=A0A0F9M6N8_9ZZZZ
MVKVDEVSEDVFQVVFTGIDLRSLSKAARNINGSKLSALAGMLAIVLCLFDHYINSERS